jgi:5-methylcytosine-specific restriction endonuclease McrA
MTAYTAEWRRLVASAIARGARCQDCGTDRDLEGDHELPVSRGGLSTRANLTIRCRKHNRAKGNRVTRYQLRVPWPYEPPGGDGSTRIRDRTHRPRATAVALSVNLGSR